MVKEKTLGLKQEGEQPSSGTDQPEKKDPEPTPEDLDKEIDETLEGAETDPEAEDLGDGKVVLSKEELDKLKKERANYREGLLAIKPKLKALKKPAPQKQEKQGEFLTRNEYQKGIERQAIVSACQDSDINDNWVKIMDYYVPKRGKTTVEGIVADVKRAHSLFRLENPLPEGDVEKETTAELASEKGKPGGKTAPLKEEKAKKKILVKTAPVEGWYGTPDKE